MKKIAFVTYAANPTITPDDNLTAEALRRMGYMVQPAVWDDPAVAWQAFDLVLIRSPWDYHHKAEAFVAWLDRLEGLGVAVENALPLLRWNAHKTYLRDLEARGIPIIPTVWVKQGEPMPALTAVWGEPHEVVVKPTVSASAYLTERLRTEELSAFKAAVDIMIQPFVREITVVGEWSLLYFDGLYSHAVKKYPQAGDFRVQSAFGGKVSLEVPTPALLEQVQGILNALDTTPLYARVDGVEVDGRFLLMELELVEPSLFLRADVDAPQRFAAAIAARV
jgi:glutathione synthase/RimK-type ligase-like ATP-grasp enzyme